jgi:regulator of nucleoside diphosphate kinase
MNHTPIYISREDYSKLRVLIATALHSNASAARARLSNELDRAAVIDPAAFPTDVVTMDSTVEFEDLGTGEIEEYTITFPEKADVALHRISILAPLGTAFIGCRVGDIVKWPTPGGIRQLRVRRVTPPGRTNVQCSPSLPIASTGQDSRASSAAAISSAVRGWRWTIEEPVSSSRAKVAGAISRQRSQSMQVEST